MKILHTSDFHLGKKLEGRDRLKEQEEVLEEIYNIILSTQTEVIICAGDIYDTYIPSAEAESLFFKYAKKFAENGRAFVVISGNHDDAKRLAASTPLSQELNIFIVGTQTNTFICTDNKKTGVSLVECGDAYILLKNEKNEFAFLSLMPYPSQHRYKEESNNLSFTEQMSVWLAKGSLQNKKKHPEILIAHTFTLGGEKTLSERDIELGGARAFPPKMLPDSQYIALGHLHKFQKVKDNAYYSGSIMQYAFDESGHDKFVLTFDLTTSGFSNFEKHKIRKGRRLVRLESDSIEYAKMLMQKYPESYIELTLHLKSPLSAQDLKELTESFELLISVIPKIDSSEQEKYSRKHLNASEMFIAYYKHKYEREPDEKLLNLYLELMELQ